MVGRVLGDGMPQTLRVIGEIGRIQTRSHWYFDLKDSGAVMSCVMWQSSTRKLNFTPQTGQQVVLTGRVDFYGPQGRTQFIADKIEAVGAGALDLALKRLVEEARTLGWLDEDRKRPLPMLPLGVAVVTSRSGAALQDVIDTFRRKCPSIPLKLADVRVQGEGAAAQIARTIHLLGRHHLRLGVEVILVTRGGGSMEDLWAFNERMVAEAIFKSPIPVVAAIGHETDVTLAELVADLRAATPTQAAMRIAPDAAALKRQLSSIGSRLGAQLTRRVSLDRHRVRSTRRHLTSAASERVQDAERSLDRLIARLERVRPAAVYERRSANLRHARQRLAAVFRDMLTRSTDTVESAARNLDLVGPHSVLKRGYSVTTAADGSVIRSVTTAKPGASIRTRVADGTFDSKITGDAPTPDVLRPVAPASQDRATRKRSTRDTRDQMDLFKPSE